MAKSRRYRFQQGEQQSWEARAPLAYACPLGPPLPSRLVCVGNWPLGTEPSELPSYQLPADSVLGRHPQGLRAGGGLLGHGSAGPSFFHPGLCPPAAVPCSPTACFPPEDGTGCSLLPGPGCLTFLTNCLHPENPSLKDPHLTLLGVPSVSCQAPEQSSWSQEQ